MFRYDLASLTQLGTWENSMKGTAALERMKKLESEMRSLKAEAHDEVVARIRSDIATLGEMGYRYQLVTQRSSGKERHSDPTRPCPVCKFVTKPYHDARHHRGQGKHKKAYTSAELAGHGLTKA